MIHFHRQPRGLYGFAVLSSIVLGLSCLTAAASNGDISPEPVRPTLQDIRAESYIVIDRNTGESILESNARKQIHPASLTKVLTAIIAIERLGDEDIITTSDYAGTLPNGESKIDLIPGEKMTFREMLYGMLLASGNDAAVAVGEHISGSWEDFAVLMNQRSEELGAQNSHWTNPSGVTMSGHYSTSADLAHLTSIALKMEDFRKVVATQVYSLQPTNKHPYTGWNVLENTNRLLRYQDSYYDSALLREVIGVKTGTTTAAGSNLITSARTTGGMDLACVINGVRERDARNIWVYTLTLLEEASRITEGVQRILDPQTPIPAGDGKPLRYPAEPFVLYNPKGIELGISVTTTDGKVTVSAGSGILFETVLMSGPDSAVESANPSGSSVHPTSVPDGPDGPNRDVVIGFVLALCFIVYAIVVWMVMERRYARKRRPRNRIG